MPTKKHRISHFEEAILDGRAQQHRESGHAINVLLLGEEGVTEIRVCANVYTNGLVLGIARAAWQKHHFSMLVESNGEPLFVIDRHGNEEIFVHPSGKAPFTHDDIHRGFPNLTLTIVEWRKMKTHLFKIVPPVTKVFS